MGPLIAASSGAGSGLFLIVFLFLYVLFALPVWGSYQKASPEGDPAWSAFVPIYNFIILLRVAGKPKTWAWFLLLLIVPYVGSLAFFIVSILVLNEVSKNFGHGGGFTAGGLAAAGCAGTGGFAAGWRRSLSPCGRVSARW